MVLRFRNLLFLLLLPLVSNAGQYGVAGSLPGSIWSHTGSISWTETPDGNGNIIVTLVGQGGSYNSDPITSTDSRMYIGWGAFGGALSLGQSATYPDGSEIFVYVQTYYGGWQFLGNPKAVILGSGGGTFKVPYKLHNPTIYEVEFGFYPVDPDTGAVGSVAAHTVTLQAGETEIGSFLTTFEAETEFQVVANYAGIFETDGDGWILDPAESTEVVLSDYVQSVEVPTPADDPPAATVTTEAPTNETTPGAPPAGAGAIAGSSTGATSVWVRPDDSIASDSLTVATFESGLAQLARAITTSRSSSGGTGDIDVDVVVDTDELADSIADLQAEVEDQTTDLLSALALQTQTLSEGAVVDPITPNDPLTPEETATPNFDDAENAVSLLPTAADLPTITMPDSVSTFSLGLEIPNVGTQYIAFDLAQWAIPISVFKAIVRAVLAVWFFFIALHTVRHAFHG